MEKYLEIGLEILMEALGWEKTVVLGHLNHLLNKEDTKVLKTALMLCSGHVEYRPEMEVNEDVNGKKRIKLEFPAFATISFTIENIRLGVDSDDITIQEHYEGDMWVGLSDRVVIKSLNFEWMLPEYGRKQYNFPILVEANSQEYFLREESYDPDRMVATGYDYNFERNCELIRKLLG